MPARNTPLEDLLLPRWLGVRDYQATWDAMRDFTETRGPDTPDEVWLLEHPPVYTLGLNGDPAHLLRATGVPLLRTDRGGQITWHGPGQLVAYVLLDLGRRQLGVRRLVTTLENAVIGLVRQYAIRAEGNRTAPGVYVDGRKLASVGLRVRRGCSYHGLSLNVNPDLAAFAAINPCGHPGLAVTSLLELGIDTIPAQVAAALVVEIEEALRSSRIGHDNRFGP